MSRRHGSGGVVDAQLVEYLVVIVPDDACVDSVLDAVETLVANRRVVVLDGAVVAHHPTGALGVAELPWSSDRPCLADTRLGVLSERDLELVAASVSPGWVGIVLVVEDDWARPLAEAARRVGGHIAGGDRILATRLREVLPALVASGEQ